MKTVSSFVLLFALQGLAMSPFARSATLSPTSMPSLSIAQQDWCQGKGRVTHFAQTKNFRVYICNTADVNYYVSYTGDGSKKGVTIPCGNGFFRSYPDAVCGAPNGEYLYILSPDALVVERQKKVILKEKVTRFHNNLKTSANAPKTIH